MSASPVTAAPSRPLERGRHAGRPSLAARLSPGVLIGAVGLVTALVVPLAGLLVAAAGTAVAAASKRRRDLPGVVVSLLGVTAAVTAWAVMGSPA